MAANADDIINNSSAKSLSIYFAVGIFIPNYDVAFTDNTFQNETWWCRYSLKTKIINSLKNEI